MRSASRSSRGGERGRVVGLVGLLGERVVDADPHRVGISGARTSGAVGGQVVGEGRAGHAVGQRERLVHLIVRAALVAAEISGVVISGAGGPGADVEVVVRDRVGAVLRVLGPVGVSAEQTPRGIREVGVLDGLHRGVDRPGEAAAGCGAHRRAGGRDGRVRQRKQPPLSRRHCLEPRPDRGCAGLDRMPRPRGRCHRDATRHCERREGCRDRKRRDGARPQSVHRSTPVTGGTCDDRPPHASTRPSALW